MSNGDDVGNDDDLKKMTEKVHLGSQADASWCAGIMHLSGRLESQEATNPMTSTLYVIVFSARATSNILSKRYISHKPQGAILAPPTCGEAVQLKSHKM